MRKQQILHEFDRVVHERTDALKRADRFESLARELYEALKKAEDRLGWGPFEIEAALSRYEREVGK